MAHLKPPWFTAKIFNRIAIATITLATKTGAATYQAHETPTPQRRPTLTGYRKKAG
jgi:hypothetical protein